MEEEIVKEFVIDRSRWLRGEGCTESYLLRKSDQKMCCLGFYLQACGVPRDNLLGNTSPSDLQSTLSDKPFPVPQQAKWLLLQYREDASQPSVACTRAMRLNDKELAGDEREARISEIFLANGVKVTFTGGEKP